MNGEAPVMSWLPHLTTSWADHVAHTSVVRPGTTAAPDFTHWQGIVPGLTEGLRISTLPDAYRAPRSACPNASPRCPAHRRDGTHSVGLQHAYSVTRTRINVLLSAFSWHAMKPMIREVWERHRAQEVAGPLACQSAHRVESNPILA